MFVISCIQSRENSFIGYMVESKYVTQASREIHVDHNLS